MTPPRKQGGGGWHRKRQTPATQARAKEYNSARHKRERKTRVAAATPSTPCGYCGQPLGTNTTEWHVPHDEHRNYLPGLWHGHCNRKEAARRGAKLRNQQAKVSPLRW